jgi:hypothetical protein
MFHTQQLGQLLNFTSLVHACLRLHLLHQYFWTSPGISSPWILTKHIEFSSCLMQLHNNGSSKFTSGMSFSISSKISIFGGQIVTEVGDGIMLISHNRTQHNLSSFLPAIFLVEKLYIYQFKKYFQ